MYFFQLQNPENVASLLKSLSPTEAANNQSIVSTEKSSRVTSALHKSANKPEIQLKSVSQENISIRSAAHPQISSPTPSVLVP
jgi:hypothetical protein